MKKNLIAAAFFPILLTACQNGKSAKDQDAVLIDSLKNQVIAGHDKAMGKMMKLEKLAALSQKNIDSLTKLGQDASAYTQLKQELDAADSSMERWMRDFDFEMENMNAKQKIDYLKGHVTRVNLVTDSVLNALDKAKQFFPSDSTMASMHMHQN